MDFVGEFVVDAPRVAVYEKIRDAEFFISCLDGVRDLEEVDATHYTAVMESKIAYLKVVFQVLVELVREQAPVLIEVEVVGRPLKLGGRLLASSVTRLEEVGCGTKIIYEANLSLTGKLGSLGRPVLIAKAKEMEKQFSKNLQNAFTLIDSDSGTK